MFYIIEKSIQLQQLPHLDDCFIHFIPFNDNIHPVIQKDKISLIYIRPLKLHKGYILCLDHSESLSLSKDEVFQFILDKTNKLFVLNKKTSLHYFSHPDKLYDINFIKSEIEVENNCLTFYYRNRFSLFNLNCLIPISKHYEFYETAFYNVFKTINSIDYNNEQYKFNNDLVTQTFFEIESSGIKLNKNSFINYYKDLQYPEFNIKEGKIYTQYNLYTVTGRPSNSFNGINFAALNKTDGERKCYKAANDILIEYDIQGFHPRIIGELVGFDFPEDENTYDVLGKILGVNKNEAKELTFKQLYGGIWPQYSNKRFFKEVSNYIDKTWNLFQKNKYIDTECRRFDIKTHPDLNKHKLFNYIIQSKETSINVKILFCIFSYLKNKKTKLVLYTYDSFLFDFCKTDGLETLNSLQDIIKYPINIKKGNIYSDLVLL